MTQMTLAVAVSIIQDAKHNEKTCPFCSEDAPEDKENFLNNDASKLRTSCKNGDVTGEAEPCQGFKGSNEWNIVYTHPETGEEEITQVRSNPHHCIPGRASLKGEFEHPILECIEKEKGTITGNIGYNVNKKENGIWLPAIPEHFYGGYKGVDPVAGISWGSLTRDYPEPQFSMAEAAMHETKRQFHDAHEDYNEHVKGRLDKIMDKVIARKTNCPDAGPKTKPNVPPPYGLVLWMDGVSKTMSSWLSCDPKRWRSPIWTSRHAKEFHEKLK